ncbi:hypothetical protein EDC01DRAFT_162258 [Geopyxis carbonaria]|nr:hypothetical protein EDC01DRAFT_162258 [Geopyxis carbonaria]
MRYVGRYRRQYKAHTRVRAREIPTARRTDAETNQLTHRRRQLYITHSINSINQSLNQSPIPQSTNVTSQLNKLNPYIEFCRPLRAASRTTKQVPTSYSHLLYSTRTSRRPTSQSRPFPRQHDTPPHDTTQHRRETWPARFCDAPARARARALARPWRPTQHRTIFPQRSAVHLKTGGRETSAAPTTTTTTATASETDPN